MEHMIDSRYHEEVLSETSKSYKEPDLVFLLKICLAASGITFNLLLLLLYLRRRLIDGQPTSVYCFLESLTFANLVSSVGIIPSLTPNDIPEDAMGFAYCFLVFYPLLFWIGNIAGVFSLFVITIDRYLCVVHPTFHMKYLERRYYSNRFITICIWILAVLMNFAAFIVISPVEGDRCEAKWATVNQFKAYSIFIFVILYGIPTFFGFLVYCRIGWKIKKSDTYAMNAFMCEQYPDLLESTSKTFDVISFFLLALFSAILWGQDQLFFLLLNLNAISSSLLLSSYRNVVTLLAYSLAFLNPVLILLSNRQVKKIASLSRKGQRSVEQ